MLYVELSAGCLIVYVGRGYSATAYLTVQWSSWGDPVLWQCCSSCRAGGRQTDSISLLPAAYWQAACHSPEGGAGVCMDGTDDIEQRSFLARAQSHDSYEESLSLWCWCHPCNYLTSVALHVKTLLHCNAMPHEDFQPVNTVIR